MTDTDALKGRIARVLYSNDFPTHMGGWDHARALAKERYADLSAAVLPIIVAEVQAVKHAAWIEGAATLDEAGYYSPAQLEAFSPYRATDTGDRR